MSTDIYRAYGISTYLKHTEKKDQQLDDVKVNKILIANPNLATPFFGDGKMTRRLPNDSGICVVAVSLVECIATSSREVHERFNCMYGL